MAHNRTHTDLCATPSRLIAALAALLIGISLFGGCQAFNSVPTGPTSQVVRGDWDDVFAAVYVSLRESEAAAVDWSEVDRRWTFTMRDTQGLKGTLEIVLEGGSAEARDGSALIHVSATFPGARDDHRAGEIVSSVTKRLRELAGRGVAPLRDTPE